MYEVHQLNGNLMGERKKNEFIINLSLVSYQPNCHSVIQQVAYFIDGATTSVCFTGPFCQSRVK